MQNDSIVIVSSVRTPLGNLLGELKDFSATELGSQVIKAAVERAELKQSDIHEVFMGCVLPAGQGQAPARQAAIHAGLSVHTPCTTINKVCGSGMKSVMLGCNEIAMGSVDIVVAGGMESMTNAPHLLQKSRLGYRLGSVEVQDHMMLDGLQDAYDKGRPMGYFAEQCVKKYGFTREQQDHFARISFERARNATEKKFFSDEIIPLVLKTKQGEKRIDKDEHPFSVNLDRMVDLAPSFAKEGTITPGNASSIADGAAALLLMRLSEAEKRGIKPIARIVGYCSVAKAPSEFPTAPIDAMRQLLKKIHWELNEIDLFEINEAFAAVALAAMHDLHLPHEKVNMYGGACALGHPIGASGARIIVTLLSALRQNQLSRGVATLCIGGGEATALAVERC